jgi:hypothetical protein
MDINKSENKVLAYLQALISNKTDADPKFAVGLFCTVLWAVMVVYHLISGHLIQNEIIFADVTLIAACFGLEVANNIKALSVKSSVASDIAKSDSSAQTNKSASDVIQNDKPS